MYINRSVLWVLRKFHFDLIYHQYLNRGYEYSHRRWVLLILQHAVLNIEYEKYPGWINQKLYCKQTDLETICREIERIHNVKIKFSNIKMKQITITGTIDTSELETMLNTIALLSQHSFKLVDGTYTVI